MKNFLKIFTVVVFAIALAVSPALAKNNKGNNGQGQGQGQEHGNSGHGNDNDNDNGNGNGNGKDKSATKWSPDNDRDVLRGYVIGHYKKDCPPGLAKKNPPCIPPGQAKKFGHGDILPEGGWVYVPDDIVVHLTPPPRGARYVRMDKDVYLITEGTRKVIEAIELFSQLD